MKPPVDWMLSGEPWIEYQTRVTLLNEPLQNPNVIASRGAMLADSRIARNHCRSARLAGEGHFQSQECRSALSSPQFPG